MLPRIAVRTAEALKRDTDASPEFSSREAAQGAETVADFRCRFPSMGQRSWERGKFKARTTSVVEISLAEMLMDGD
jgi:hypothetical protein